MVTAPLPPDEADRLATLAAFQVLDTPPERAFDDLVALAARVCGVPIGLVSLVDAGRQWFKAAVGLAVPQTPRDVSFCGHAILEPDLMVVPDAEADPRFHDNPLVVGDPGVRFYAGMPLVASGGHAVGSLCVMDRSPRTLTPEQADTLRVLGRQVVILLEHRRAARALHDSESRFRVAAGCATDLIYDWDVATGRLDWFGDIDAAVGYPPGGFPRTLAAWEAAIHPDDRPAVLAALDATCRTGQPFVQQYRVVRRDGSARYWEERGAPAPYRDDAGGRPGAAGDSVPVRRLVGAVADVTDKRLAEQALHETDARLRHQNDALVDLARQRAFGGDDLRAAVGAVTAAAAHTLDVGRTSVWLYDEGRTKIRCLDLFERPAGRHSDGAELAAADYPAYFAALEEDRTIAAHDARTDRCTREFAAGYLVPLGITSMLDAPIRVGGRTVGVLCCEQVGPARRWTVDECAFVDSLTNVVAVAAGAADRCRAEAARRDSEGRFRAFMDHSPAATFLKDDQGRLVYYNGRLRERFAIGGDEWLGRAFYDLWQPDVAERLRAMDASVVATGRAAEAHEAVRAADGQDEHWLFLAFPVDAGDAAGTAPAAGPGGRLLGGIALDVTRQRRAELAMAHAARHDALTGLPNRQLFRDRVGLCLDRARREPGYRFAVLFADLDGFKLVNDSLGHAVGDGVLVEVGRRLDACVRAAAAARAVTVARMGGDEFLVLLDGVGDPAGVDRAADRVVRALAEPHQVGGSEVVTPASVGIAHGDARYAAAEDLLRDADAAMYRAKALGKSRCVTFDPTLHAAALSRLRLEADLRRAVERGELVLHYQPIVCLDSRRTAGFEALLRWRRDGRLVSPADFIPAAEETGLIVPIGAWVLAEACRQLAAWRAGRPDAGDLTINVNVSRRQLAAPGFVGHVRAALAAAGGPPPELLKLEITESIVMDDSIAARAVLDDIRTLGVRLQMDDFGTGYSSLSCLSKLPLDGLKIDRAFIRDVSGRRDAVAVLQAITSLAHNLRMEVVAEGLETPEQVALLQSLDCDYGQGYYFAKPLPAAEATAFLAASAAPRPLAVPA
jgi:diguanylate cyclase (GGDEF)-like protein/PAS domain S-box-containing protein